jgi:hypothetical protein
MFATTKQHSELGVRVLKLAEAMLDMQKSSNNINLSLLETITKLTEKVKAQDVMIEKLSKLVGK